VPLPLWRIPVQIRGLKQNKTTTETVVFLFWQGHLCNSRADAMRELLMFGKDIKVFLETIFKR
jgi:hypothetical protein